MACETCGTTTSLNPDCSRHDNPELPVIPPEDEITAPDANTVTEEVVDGNGVFDIYMRAGMNQLNTQYTEGRIKGADYAAAYIAMTELMMTQANAFVVQIFEAEMKAKMFGVQFYKAKYDALLAESQAKKMAFDADFVCQQIAELKANGETERGLKKSQTNVQVKQADLYTRQITGYNEKHQGDVAKVLFDAWAVQAVEEPYVTYQIDNLLSEQMNDMVNQMRNSSPLI